MILERLQLNNFRCYAGSVEFHFAMDDQRNTTVILGTNGAGKTSILHGLNFALYGREAVTSESPLINNDILKLGREHEPAQGSVTLEFRDRGIAYKLTRTARGFLVNDRFHFADSADEVSLTYITPDGNTEKEALPLQRIESMLPRPIRTFFLFDGDRIADFTKPGRERDATISKAVNDVLHIEALSRAVDHTGKIAADKKRALIAAAPPSTERTTLDIKLEEAALRNRRERLEQIDRELLERTDRRDEVDSELSTILEVARKAQGRRELEKSRDGLVQRTSELKRRLARCILDATPALASRRIDQAKEVLGRFKARHEIPARIADYFLQDLLEEGMCICGRPLDDGSHAREGLQNLLRSLVPNSLQDVATDLSSRLRVLKADSGAGIASLVSALKDISNNSTEISKLDRELEKIGDEIDAAAFERSQSLNRERVSISKRIEELRGEQVRAQRDAELAERKLKLLEDKLRAESAKRDGLRELNRSWSLAQSVSESLLQAKTLLEDRLRESLGAEATAILRNLVSDPKKYFFANVRIDRGFLLRVLDGAGRDVRAQLSMGETQVSSLAFMLAMTRLGGQQAPLVVDTPLARLDKSVRSNAARWLPTLTPQLVLLVTDAEYDGEVVEALRDHVGRQYRLMPDARGTQVEGEAYASR